jgi:hypothetical protein
VEKLRALLGPLKVLPSSRGRWVALQEGILTDDDSVLSAHFADAEGVHFLKVGAQRCPARRWHLQCVDTDVAGSQLAACAAVQPLV